MPEYTPIYSHLTIVRFDARWHSKRGASGAGAPEGPTHRTGGMPMPEPAGGVTTQLQYPDGTTRAFHHRGSPADQGAIRQLFVEQQYSLRRLARGAELLRSYDAIAAAGRAPLIVDAGANIGASAVWFAGEFP